MCIIAYGLNLNLWSVIRATLLASFTAVFAIDQWSNALLPAYTMMRETGVWGTKCSAKPHHTRKSKHIHKKSNHCLHRQWLLFCVRVFGLLSFGSKVIHFCLKKLCRLSWQRTGAGLVLYYRCKYIVDVERESLGLHFTLHVWQLTTADLQRPAYICHIRPASVNHMCRVC